MDHFFGVTFDEFPKTEKNSVAEFLISEMID